MANAKFAYFNLLTQDETELEITAGGEDAFYPLSNLKHPHALKTFRSSTDVTSVIVIDFQTPASFDTFLSVGNSIGTLDLTAATIEANAIDEWTSPAFSYEVSDFDYAANFMSASFATQTWRYVRLTLTGTSDFVEIGKLFLGHAVQLTNNNVAIGFTSVNRDLSTVEKGRYGQRFIDLITTQRLITGSIGLMNTEEQAQIEAVYDYCGISKPLWFVLDPDELFTENKDTRSGYFYFNETPAFTNDFFGLYSTQFTLEEAK